MQYKITSIESTLGARFALDKLPWKCNTQIMLSGDIQKPIRIMPSRSQIMSQIIGDDLLMNLDLVTGKVSAPSPWQLAVCQDKGHFFTITANGASICTRCGTVNSDR